MKKLAAIILSFGLFFQQTGFAQVSAELSLGSYFNRAQNSLVRDNFRLPHLRYFSYNNSDNSFRLLVDKGDGKELTEAALGDESRVLLNYFLVGVTLPDNVFWVNLRPDGEENIIEDYLALTDVGRVLLEADLQLKKDTAKFTSPQNPEGKTYWDRLYAKANELFGQENITIPTLTRPWIVPGEIIVREDEGSAYVYKANLRVMLEQDHLKGSAAYNFTDPRLKILNEYASELMRELIIPKLTKEVNNARRYAQLRQVYYSLILARWFKFKFSEQPGIYPSLIDKSNLNGLVSSEPWSKTTYFNAYKKSFQEGEYNLKENVQVFSGPSVRTYFSGGMDLAGIKFTTGAASPVAGFKGQGDILRPLLRKTVMLGLAGIAGMGGLSRITPQTMAQTLAQNTDRQEIEQVQDVEYKARNIEFKVKGDKRLEGSFQLWLTDLFKVKESQTLVVKFTNYEKLVGKNVTLKMWDQPRGILPYLKERSYTGVVSPKGEVIFNFEKGQAFRDHRPQFITSPENLTGETGIESIKIVTPRIVKLEQVAAADQVGFKLRTENKLPGFFYLQLNRPEPIKTTAAVEVRLTNFENIIGEEMTARIVVETPAGLKEHLTGGSGIVSPEGVVTFEVKGGDVKATEIDLLTKSGKMTRKVGVGSMRIITPEKKIGSSPLLTVNEAAAYAALKDSKLIRETTGQSGEKSFTILQNRAPGLRTAVSVREVSYNSQKEAIAGMQEALKGYKLQDLRPQILENPALLETYLRAQGDRIPGSHGQFYETEDQIVKINKFLVDPINMALGDVTSGAPGAPVEGLRELVGDLSLVNRYAGEIKKNLIGDQVLILARGDGILTFPQSFEGSDFKSKSVGVSILKNNGKLAYHFDSAFMDASPRTRKLLEVALNRVNQENEYQSYVKDGIISDAPGLMPYVVTNWTPEMKDKQGRMMVGYGSKKEMLFEARKIAQKFVTVKLAGQEKIDYDALAKKGVIKEVTGSTGKPAFIVQKNWVGFMPNMKFDITSYPTQKEALAEAKKLFGRYRLWDIRSEILRQPELLEIYLRAIGSVQGSGAKYDAEALVNLIKWDVVEKRDRNRLSFVTEGAGTPAQGLNGLARDLLTIAENTDKIKAEMTGKAINGIVDSFGRITELNQKFYTRTEDLQAGNYPVTLTKASGGGVSYYFDKRFPSAPQKAKELMEITALRLSQPSHAEAALAKKQGAASPLKTEDSFPLSESRPAAPGGIDFRTMEMMIQPMGRFNGLNFTLPAANRVQNIDADESLKQIRNMVEKKIMPSGDRVKEMLAVVFARGEFEQRADEIQLCLVDICRLEEELTDDTSPQLREALVIFDTQKFIVQ